MFFTYQFVNIHLESGVIVDLGTIQMDEEENVRPHVVFLTDVMFKTLKQLILFIKNNP